MLPLTSSELGYAVIFFSGVLLASFPSRVRESYVNILMYLFEWNRTSKSHAQHGFQPDAITNDETVDCVKTVLSRTNNIKNPGWLAVEDSLYFIETGVEAIIEDEVTTRFQAEKLKSWNMLTRSIHLFNECINWKLTLIWALGVLFRYFVLLPFRLILFYAGTLLLIMATTAIGTLPNGVLKQWLNMKCMLFCYRILMRAVSAIIHFHGQENRAMNGEGTCINNTSVMMFKKGSFEVGAKIYPIAMKYDSRFGDAFWNSSEQSWVGYIMQMITSWAIICHVWYLPPMEKLENENAIDFANRVKKAIARRAGLLDLEWDGQLKRSKIPLKLITEQQKRYYQQFLLYLS
ncbi:glycerol-3-phosphate acyltransferase 4 [Ditylenchus destructor]|nr:glycerol-3-phosphate acyltransferase 4 [Ditylenchus destructor]